MTDPGGGFYSAEDADSLPPEEARTRGAQVGGRLLPVGGRRGRRTCSARTPDWRGRDSASSLAAMRRSTRTASSPARTCVFSRRPWRGWRPSTGSACRRPSADSPQRARRMYEARAGRPRPQLDDKILTAWNGLMIAAFARGFRVLRSAHTSRRPSGPHGSWRRRCGGRRAGRSTAATARGTWPSTATPRTTPASCGGCSSSSRPTATRVARVGPGAAAAAGRAVLGRWRRWLVRDDRDRSLGHRADEGGLRRRRAVGDSVSVANLIVLAHLTGDAAWRSRIERTLRRAQPPASAARRAACR